MARSSFAAFAAINKATTRGNPSIIELKPGSSAGTPATHLAAWAFVVDNTIITIALATDTDLVVLLVDDEIFWANIVVVDRHVAKKIVFTIVVALHLEPHCFGEIGGRAATAYLALSAPLH